MMHLFNLKVKLIPVVNKILSFLFFGLSDEDMNLVNHLIIVIV